MEPTSRLHCTLVTVSGSVCQSGQALESHLPQKAGQHTVPPAERTPMRHIEVESQRILDDVSTVAGGRHTRASSLAPLLAAPAVIAHRWYRLHALRSRTRSQLVARPVHPPRRSKPSMPAHSAAASREDHIGAFTWSTVRQWESSHATFTAKHAGRHGVPPGQAGAYPLAAG
eukprot:22926-Prymnesium_polylepis.1